MVYNVELKPEATEELLKFDKEVGQRILSKLNWLSESYDSLNPEAATAQLKGLFKLRIGSYRALYNVNKKEGIITVHLIGHRKNVYKAK
ncbi:MAG: type II toxin-antitoxin system RelE/ParE family toxin [Dehalococcoidia bacterium]|nr:type II toxin-antitoxin system RelE/ParE family toxin [Dehalococcoidia bacterium]